MMMSEFTERTGIEPNAEEYAMIEEMYYEYDGDKNAFCKDFVEKNRMIEVQRKIAEDLQTRLDELHKAMDAAYIEMENANKRIRKLEADLEREQEWKPYEETHNCSDEKYDELARTSASDEMTDEEAVDMIAKEFGFVPEKIHIVHWAPKYEINRHNQLRQVGQKVRRPRFAAWDWNYIRFNVIGNVARAYEMVDGELKLFWD